LLNGGRNVMMQASVLTEVSVPPFIFNTHRAELRLRPATRKELPELRRLVEESRHAHVQLDWWTWEDWVGNPGFLVADEGGRIVGVGLGVRDASQVAWLRAVVAEDRLDLGALLDALLPPMMATLRSQGVKALACLAWPEWLSDKLPERGFEPLAQVITLRKNDMTSPAVRLPPVLAREASPADLDDVAAIDHAAFETAWWYGETTFFRALRDAMRFCVAERDRQPLGYAFAHKNGAQAHVTRIAVHPAHQRQGIGTLMLADLIEHARAQGAEFITLNTQTHNENSLKLYRRFGFEPVGHGVIAWIRSTEPQG
jgi:ribosomal-protein-alanine N-acetyltransferase